jgi:hypothetical protein
MCENLSSNTCPMMSIAGSQSAPEEFREKRAVISDGADKRS